MQDVIEAGGFFLYPLLLLSVIGVAVVLERSLALRTARVVPRHLFLELLDGEAPEPAAQDRSLLAEILRFHHRQQPTEEALVAFGIFQSNRLERGLFLIDVVVAGAPLLGLLGTVTGLVTVFSGFSPSDGLPDAAIFIEGIGMALSTTILGLAAAIPALIAGAWLNRRVEVLSSRLNVAVQQILCSGRRGREGKAG